MGLSVSVGTLADLKKHDPEGADWLREDLQRAQQLLQSHGAGGWQEPEELGELRLRPHVSSFPYSFLHYLRRAYAWAVERPGTPLEPAEDLSVEDEQLIDVASAGMDSHLLCHSDAEGFYVPVDLREPLFDVEDKGVPGGVVGSSQGLLRELQRVAPMLGIQLGPQGTLADEEAQHVHEESMQEGQPFFREKLVWLALYECAQASVTHRTALCFG
jgi:hypothetical protein